MRRGRRPREGKGGEDVGDWPFGGVLMGGRRGGRFSETEKASESVL